MGALRDMVANNLLPLLSLTAEDIAASARAARRHEEGV
jgi:glucose-6-phosphate 1-dehydrogenase